MSDNTAVDVHKERGSQERTRGGEAAKRYLKTKRCKEVRSVAKRKEMQKQKMTPNAQQCCTWGRKRLTNRQEARQELELEGGDSPAYDTKSHCCG